MTILLAIHIFLSTITLVFTALAAVATARQKKATGQLAAMWYSFGGIILTGFGLLIVNPNSLGHLCVLAAVYAALLSSVQMYSKKNPAVSSVQNIQ